MVEWIHLTVMAVFAGVLIVLVISLLRRCCYPNQHKICSGTKTERTQNLQTGIAKLHQSTLHHQIDHHHHQQQHNMKPKTQLSVFRRGSPASLLFNWADNPSLVTDAVENGWSQFAFTTHTTSSPSVRSTRSAIFGACVDRRREADVDVYWEVCQGSADFMQKIRFNSGLKKKISTVHSSISVIKTALPLPGPPLGNSSFPQEAYFEITTLPSVGDDHETFGKRKVGRAECEKTKLIQQNSGGLIHVNSSNGHGNNKLEELKLVGGKGDGKGETVILSVGLTRGGSLPLKLPGSYLGSIGFNSNGSVYLDGIKVVLESEKQEWGKPGKVIGCGYNPSQRKVFFTIDSELVQVIDCKSEEFGTPLYPTLAANSEIMVLVNFGQSVFKYAPANTQRTPNPCFIGPLANSPTLGYEDSKELFSMGRIDSQWLNRNTTRSGLNNNNKGLDFDEESEGELFEIVLDNCGKSPHAAL